MILKEKITDKKSALLQATLMLVNENGFHNASMSKIAKRAGVATATIYLYFENKQDLINTLYLEVKSSFSTFAFKEYTETMHVKKGFELIWNNIADYKLNTVNEATFLSQCDTTPMISAEIRKEGLKHLQILLDLWERGKKEGIIMPLPNIVLYAYSIYPLSFLLAMQKEGQIAIDPDLKVKSFQAAWNAIRA